ncbi:hypothetical protein [uncultured Fibrella sp.]|uniref:hypothetical protein n=1 Tax=uncultured Fibrella sp. TaxID=1284596 RepID=UPI0035CBE8F4
MRNLCLRLVIITVWDTLIQPLGEGRYDTYGFLKTFWDKVVDRHLLAGTSLTITTD